MHTIKNKIRKPLFCAFVHAAGDKSALRPSGLRLGSPALTSRGLVEEDFRVVAEYIHRCELIAFYNILFRKVRIVILINIVICLFGCRYSVNDWDPDKHESQSHSEGVQGNSGSGWEIPKENRRNPRWSWGFCWKVPHAWTARAMSLILILCSDTWASTAISCHVYHTLCGVNKCACKWIKENSELCMTQVVNKSKFNRNLSYNVLFKA